MDKNANYVYINALAIKMEKLSLMDRIEDVGSANNPFSQGTDFPLLGNHTRINYEPM
jgi:hypothetical protein